MTTWTIKNKKINRTVNYLTIVEVLETFERMTAEERVNYKIECEVNERRYELDYDGLMNQMALV